MSILPVVKYAVVGVFFLVIFGEKVMGTNEPDSSIVLIKHRSVAKYVAFGLETQAYPTGIIPGIRLEYVRQHHNINLRLGYQLINHRDLGVHESEKGSGLGFTVGYRYHSSRFDPANWFLGVRNDIWFNELDWKDNIGQVDGMGQSLEVSGTSNIVVVQPTIEAGYTFYLGTHFFLSPSLSFGYEVNVRTEGAEVGQGAILLLGVSLMYH